MRIAFTYLAQVYIEMALWRWIGNFIANYAGVAVGSGCGKSENGGKMGKRKCGEEGLQGMAGNLKVGEQCFESWEGQGNTPYTPETDKNECTSLLKDLISHLRCTVGGDDIINIMGDVTMGVIGLDEVVGLLAVDKNDVIEAVDDC
nr:hypothetical protein [Tanacetum cinerariifolium]